MAARAAGHQWDVDIVQRALAILDEESRAWVQRPPPLVSPAETAPQADDDGDGR